MYCLFNIIVLHLQLVVELVVEAAAGATVAAALSDKLKQMNSNMENIGITLCGGNVEIDSLPWYTHGW